MDGTVDTTAPEQRPVRRIDDSSDLERSDVGNADLEPRLPTSAIGAGAGGGIETLNQRRCGIRFRKSPRSASTSPPSPTRPALQGLSAGMPIVRRRPMASKCVSRKRRSLAGRACAASRSIRIRSSSVLRRATLRPIILHSIRCSLSRRNWPRPTPRGSRPSSISRLTKAIAAQLREQRRVEVNLVHSAPDLTRAHRHLAPVERIDLDQQHILGGGCAQEWDQRRITAVAAVPIGHAIDLDCAEQRGRQAEAITTSAVISARVKTRVSPLCAHRSRK